MEEIYQQQARMDADRLELAMAEARYEAVNDLIQAYLVVTNAQITALVYASLNPNFCKPKET